MTRVINVNIPGVKSLVNPTLAQTTPMMQRFIPPQSPAPATQAPPSTYQPPMPAGGMGQQQQPSQAQQPQAPMPQRKPMPPQAMGSQQPSYGGYARGGFASGGTTNINVPYSNNVANVPVGGTSGTPTSSAIAQIGANGTVAGSPPAPMTFANTSQSPIPFPGVDSYITPTSTPDYTTGGAPTYNWTASPIPAGVVLKRGGVAKLAAGGIPTSEALSPWYARSEQRGALQPEGLIRSNSGGRTDVHSINVPSGSYVVPADVVSGIGEGNTLSGAGIMDKMMHSNPYGVEGGAQRGRMGPPRAPAPFKDPTEVPLESRGGNTKGKSGVVPIIVAGGEILLHPQTIIKKFGSLDKGHAVLDKWVVESRKQIAKTMLKLPGPKGASKK